MVMHINIGRVSIIIEKSYNISKQGDRGESESDLIGTVRIVCTFYNITHDPALPSMDVIPSFLLFSVGLVVFQMMVTLYVHNPYILYQFTQLPESKFNRVLIGYS